VGVELTGKLREGCTATDLVLTVTELLRKHKVVGKFVEFFGEGTRSLAVPDRATIANMAPEYGATMGFFPVDERTIDYFEGTGRSKDEIRFLEAYFKAQGMFGVPAAGEIDYSTVVRLDLGEVTPSLSGPKRPQDRIELGKVAGTFRSLFSRPIGENGFNQSADVLLTRHLVERPNVDEDQEHVPDEHIPENPPAPLAAPRFEVEMEANKPTMRAAHAMSVPLVEGGGITIGNGDVLIAAITSCTNTSNPGVLLAAGLLAKKAVEKGLKVQPHIKTSLSPGSRIVTEYLQDAGLLPYLEQLGFTLAGYGCMTCIGNSGDLTPEINQAISESDLVCASVLSGNRNFEARIHPNIKANFLASPPLVVAYAIAGTVLKDLMTEPVGQGEDGKDVWLGDIWPSSDEIHKLMKYAMNARRYRANYAKVKTEPGVLWEDIQGVAGDTYNWPKSTYIAEPPFFDDFTLELPEVAPLKVGDPGPNVIRDARVIALFGDSITTDHISPAGSIKDTSPAGRWLQAHGVLKPDFNSYGSRRGNHEVMMRGTFANVRIRNLMLPPGADGSREEGGLTLYRGADGRVEKMFIYDAAMKYMAEGRSTVVFAGEEYGTGSSRDWAAKGTQLLGIKAVVARSFERIHRSNLVGMGVLPLQFEGDMSWQTLGLTGDEMIDIIPDPQLRPQSQAVMVIRQPGAESREVKLRLRIDTTIEVDYYRHGGILPYVLRQLLAA
ncbi:MAG: acnA, partial [Ramlibacter sp.]|nr:acnA [Ramlibacter sp.]